MTHGVIGNTADFGSVVQGSSPCGSTNANKALAQVRAFLFPGSIKSIPKTPGREACPD